MTKILIRVVGKYLIRECIIKDGLFLFLKELSAFKEEYPNIQHLENVICTLKKNFLLKIYPNLLEAINLKEVVLKINIHSPFKLPLFDEIHLQFNDFSYADLILTKNDTYEISNFTIDNRTDDKLSVIDTMNKIDNFTKILGINYAK